MALFSSEGLTYANACKLIEALSAVGIPANITAGGIAIRCEPNQINTARSVCQRFNASFVAGFTSSQENLLIKEGSQDVVRQVTDNSQSVINEWQDNGC